MFETEVGKSSSEVGMFETEVGKSVKLPQLTANYKLLTQSLMLLAARYSLGKGFKAEKN